MKKVVAFLQISTLSFVFSVVLGFFVTPQSAWNAFDSSPEMAHLLVVHVLKMLSGAAGLTPIVALIFCGIGLWIDKSIAQQAAGESQINSGEPVQD